MSPRQPREERQPLQPTLRIGHELGTTSDCHTSANGSFRVRHVRGAFAVDGNAPLCQCRAARSRPRRPAKIIVVDHKAIAIYFSAVRIGGIRCQTTPKKLVSLI